MYPEITLRNPIGTEKVKTNLWCTNSAYIPICLSRRMMTIISKEKGPAARSVTTTPPTPLTHPTDVVRVMFPLTQTTCVVYTTQS